MKTTTINTNMVHDNLQRSAWLNFLLYHVINDHVINDHVINDHVISDHNTSYCRDDG